MLELLELLDVRTLIGVLCWGSAVSVVLILACHAFGEVMVEYKTVRYFVMAKAFLTVAYGLLFYRGQIPDLLSVNLGNTLLFAGFYMEAVTMLKLIQADSKLLMNTLLGFLVLSVVFFNVAELLFENQAFRVTIASVCVFSIMLVPSIKLISIKANGRFKRVVGIFYIVFTAMLLPRAVYTMFHNDVNILTNFGAQILMCLSLTILMIVGLAAYFQMVSEYSDRLTLSMMSTDFLTGIANRQGFLERGNMIFTKHRSHNLPLSILYIDLDHFKKVNDDYGCEVGDEVIKEAANSIRSALRDNDLLCRYSGEKFLVLLDSVKSIEGLKVAERIRVRFDKAKMTDFELTVTVSIGVASGIPQKNDTLLQCINLAEGAKSKAKREGRNRTVFQSIE